MKNKEIIELLKTDEVKFTIKNITDYKNEPVIFKTRAMVEGYTYPLYSIEEDSMFGGSMNIDKFNPSYLKAYSYNIFKGRSDYILKYSDITFIEE